MARKNRIAASRVPIGIAQMRRVAAVESICRAPGSFGITKLLEYLLRAEGESVGRDIDSRDPEEPGILQQHRGLDGPKHDQ